eukprot:12957077-Heterocapsa_arctica.AAC.1
MLRLPKGDGSLHGKAPEGASRPRGEALEAQGQHAAAAARSAFGPGGPRAPGGPVAAAAPAAGPPEAAPAADQPAGPEAGPPGEAPAVAEGTPASAH